MRAHAWALMFFAVFMTVSLIIYFGFGKREIEKYTIEKTPIFKLGVNIDVDQYSNKLEKTRNLSYFSSGMMDLDYFVGNMKIDLNSNEIEIEPLTPNMYEDYRNLIVSIDDNYKEKTDYIEFFGLRLSLKQLKTSSIYMLLKPTIYILDLNEYDTETIEFINNRYFLLKEDEYKSWSFTKDILDNLDIYGSVIIDEKLLEKENVKLLFENLSENGIMSQREFKIINFKED
ncbi:MAG: hypothetical protein ACQESN_06300 [Thermotogota bacterium]